MKNKPSIIFKAVLLGAALSLAAAPAEAKRKRQPIRQTVAKSQIANGHVVAPKGIARAAYVCVPDVDQKGQNVGCQSLDSDEFNRSVDESIPPASLTKIETAFQVWLDAKNKGISLDAPFIVLSQADIDEGRMGERNGVVSNLGGMCPSLRAGDKLTRREAIVSMTAASANCVAVASAKALAPDGREETFAARMTAQLHQAGLTGITYKNASGMPATGHVANARQIALRLDYIVNTMGLGEFRSLYGQTRPVVAGRHLRNTLPIISNPDLCIVGAKTGYQNDTSNVAIVSDCNGTRTITVVLGSPNGSSRNAFVKDLLQRAFNWMASPAYAKPQTPKPTQGTITQAQTERAIAATSSPATPELPPGL